MGPRLPNMVGDVAVEDVIGPHDGGMICEKHPEREWPHSDPSESDGECPGPGMPLSGRIAGLVWQRDDARLRAVRTESDLTQVREKYMELIYASGKKYPGETRHQTVLRYIQEAESGTVRVSHDSSSGSVCEKCEGDKSVCKRCEQPAGRCYCLYCDDGIPLKTCPACGRIK